MKRFYDEYHVRDRLSLCGYSDARHIILTVDMSED